MTKAQALRLYDLFTVGYILKYRDEIVISAYENILVGPVFETAVDKEIEAVVIVASDFDVYSPLENWWDAK
jgi:hypothetical protein